MIYTVNKKTKRHVLAYDNDAEAAIKALHPIDFEIDGYDLVKADSEGWITHDGSHEAPAPWDAKVDLVSRCGEVTYSGIKATAADWRAVAKYRVSKQQENKMEQVTLQPGDYVLTEGMTEDDYHAVAAAFMAAGAKRHAMCQGLHWDCLGWSVECGFKGWDPGSLEYDRSKRQLTIAQVLSATNAGRQPHGADMPNFRCILTPNIEEPKEIHIIDELEQARDEMLKAQAIHATLEFQARKQYPWLFDAQPTEPAEDLDDPANWKAGDLVECVRAETGLYTTGKIYNLTLYEGELVVCDDEGDGSGSNLYGTVSKFRFHSRPAK